MRRTCFSLLHETRDSLALISVRFDMCKQGVIRAALSHAADPAHLPSIEPHPLRVARGRRPGTAVHTFGATEQDDAALTQLVSYLQQRRSIASASSAVDAAVRYLEQCIARGEIRPSPARMRGPLRFGKRSLLPDLRDGIEAG